jgi:hypothetical protein
MATAARATAIHGFLGLHGCPAEVEVIVIGFWVIRLIH